MTFFKNLSMKGYEWIGWALVLVWGLGAAIPAEVWFEPKMLYVRKDDNGQWEILFTRDLDYSFKGRYVVTVRDERDTVVLQETSGTFTYKKNSRLPEKITMDWWAPTIAEGFENLPDGIYQIETCWVIDSPLGILPDKTVCVTSNIFEVGND